MFPGHLLAVTGGDGPQGTQPELSQQTEPRTAVAEPSSPCWETGPHSIKAGFADCISTTHQRTSSSAKALKNDSDLFVSTEELKKEAGF